jgi:hypothetical protein
MQIFDKIARSWEFSKISYSILFKNYSLLIFPIISTITLIIVTLSFWLPLWGMGFFEHMRDADESTGGNGFFAPLNLIVVFLFYFLSYFVIFFFNSALTACAVKAINNQEVTVAAGLNVAIRRLPQIIAWSLISAVVGLLLQIVENINEKVGAIIAAILGTAWSVITFFVVPVIVVEGFGPVTAIKRSTFVLKSTWGEGLVGNISLGLINFLLTIPVLLVCVFLMIAASSLNSAIVTVLALVLSAILLSIFFAATSAAGIVFKAVLFNYATGAAIPAGLDKSSFQSAFRVK